MSLKPTGICRIAFAAFAIVWIASAVAVHAATACDYSFERTAGAIWQDGLYIGNGSHGVIAYAPAHLEWVVNKNDVFDRRVSKCDYIRHEEVMEYIRTNSIKSVFFLKDRERCENGGTGADGLTSSITPAILRMRFWNGVGWSAPSVPRTDQRIDMMRGELVEEMRSPSLAPQVTTIVPREQDVVAIRLRNPTDPNLLAIVEITRPEDPRLESQPVFETNGDVVSFEQRLPYGDSYAVAICATGKGNVARSGMVARLRGDCRRDFFLAVRRSRKEAVAAVRAAADLGFDALMGKNAAWWRNFWEQGATAKFSSEPEIDRNWKYSLFALAGQFGAAPMPSLNGLFYGPLDTGTAGVGFNCYVHDQNVQIPMLPFFPLNHCGFARTFASTYAACMDELKRHTKELFGASAEGAYLPLNMNPEGFEHPVRHYRYTLCGGAYSGLVLAKAWQHSRDPELMKDLYPVLKEFIRFYVSTMTRDKDGTCHFIWSVPPEIFTGSHDELAVISCLKPCLEAAIEGAAILGTDAEEAEVWKDILAHYPSFAKQSGGGWWGGPEIPDDHYMYGGHLFYPFFPAETDLDCDAAEKTLAYTWTNAVEIAWTTDEPHPLHEWSAFYTGTTRMRIHDPADGWKAMTDFFDWFCKPNGFFSHNPVIITDMTREKMLANRQRLPALRLRGTNGRISDWSRGDGLDLTANRDAKRLVCPVLEGGAAFLHLATESLMQSWSGEIRLFPCVPPGFTGRFSRFRTRNGFIVSAEMKNGRVVDFSVDGVGRGKSVMVTCPTDPEFGQKRIGSSGSVALVPDGVEIVVAKKAPPVVKFASKEMKHFLDGVLSCDVPVVDAPTGRRTPIHLGSGKWTKEAGIFVEGLARDSFRIVVSDKAIFIAGRDDAKVDPEWAFSRNVWSQHYERATLFGVYEFLERFAGVRMYFPGELGEVIPKSCRIVVPVGDFTVAPDMSGRSYSYFDEGVWFEGEKRDANSTGHLRWLNSYRLRMQTRYLPFNHGLSHRGYLLRFGKSHPEYFRLNKDGSRDMNIALGKKSGKLCYSSGIWSEIYLDAKSYLRGEKADVRGVINPVGDIGWWYSCQEGRYVDLMPHDGMVPCECEECKTAYDKDDPGNYMDTMIWSNMAKIGNRLISEGVSGYVTQMAYQPYARVPDVDLPPNILVMVAERGPWSVPYPDDLKREYAEVAAWAKKLGHKVAIWTYPCKYGKRNVPNIPSLSPWMWGKYYKEVSPWVNYIFAQSDSDRFIHHHLDHYVLSRVSWNTKVDVDAVIDEYFQLMYGAAASEMKMFFKSLEEKWTVGFLSRGENTMWGPSFNVASPEDRWEKVYTAELLAKYSLLFSKAQEKTAEGSLERRRVELMRSELLEPLVAERAAFAGLAGRLAAENFKFDAGKPLTLRVCGKSKEFVPADLRTEVVAEDFAGGLIVRVTAYEPKMGDVVALKRSFDDEEISNDNALEVMIDPTGSRREIMHFLVNSDGSWADLVHLKDKFNSWNNDWKWNSGAKVAVNCFADRWTCEISIPSADFPDGLPKKFPAEVFRNRVLKANAGKKDWYIWGRYSSGPCDFGNFGTWELVDKRRTRHAGLLK